MVKRPRIDFNLRRTVPTKNGFSTSELASPQTADKLMEKANLKKRMEQISAERKGTGTKSHLPLGVAIENAWQLAPQHAKERMEFETAKPNKKHEFTDIEKMRLIYSFPKAKAEFFRTMRLYTDEKTFHGRLLEHDFVIEGYFGNRKFSMADVGCSHGITTEQTAKRNPNAKITGFDSFFPREFSKTGKKAEYQEHNILLEPLPKKFDCIRFANVNPHLTAKGKSIARRNLVASLNENGLLISNDYETANGRNAKITRVYRKKGKKLVLMKKFKDMDSRDMDF